MAAIEAKAVDSKLVDRLAAVETKLNRPNVNRPDNDNLPSSERKAFTSFLRLGEQRMPAGLAVSGPAVIESLESTILVPPAWQAAMDDNGFVLLTRRQNRKEGQ